MSRPHPAGTTSAGRKTRLASAISRTPWDRVVRAAEARLAPIRVFNYHGTPARHRDSLARQLEWLSGRYRLAAASQLEELLSVPPESPTAVVTFDDGLATNAEVALPLLEAIGATGIVSVIAAFPDVPPAGQPEWFRSHVRRSADAEHAEPEDLVAIGWEELGEIAARGHRICCHTQTHLRISAGTDDAALQREIVDAREVLETRLATTVDGFCWPVARPPGARRAEELIRATYRYALCDGPRPLMSPHDPFRVYRTNVEASWPIDVLELQLSGLIDVKFAARAARHALAVARGGA